MTVNKLNTNNSLIKYDYFHITMFKFPNHLLTQPHTDTRADQ